MPTTYTAVELENGSDEFQDAADKLCQEPGNVEFNRFLGLKFGKGPNGYFAFGQDYK